MRTSTSFAILSLLAAAGSSMGAPIQAPKDVTKVVQKMTHGHRRSDSVVVDVMQDFPVCRGFDHVSRCAAIIGRKGNADTTP